MALKVILTRKGIITAAVILAAADRRLPDGQSRVAARRVPS